MRRIKTNKTVVRGPDAPLLRREGVWRQAAAPLASTTPCAVVMHTGQDGGAVHARVLASPPSQWPISVVGITSCSRGGTQQHARQWHAIVRCGIGAEQSLAG